MAMECAEAGPAAVAFPSPRLWVAALDVWTGVLAAALEDKATNGEGRNGRLRQVKTFLLQHLDDPDLDAETVAKRMNMSCRTLMRLFAAEGTTPLKWLWNERLRASRQALRQGRFKRVTDAAFAFGYRSHSHFSRSFKALYGCTPTQIIKDGTDADLNSYASVGAP
jgi:AraC-like DNA-binding protein